MYISTKAPAETVGGRGECSNGALLILMHVRSYVKRPYCHNTETNQRFRTEPRTGETLTSEYVTAETANIARDITGK
jgi:hypothetical protein